MSSGHFINKFVMQKGFSVNKLPHDLNELPICLTGVRYDYFYSNINFVFYCHLSLSLKFVDFFN